MWDTVARLVVLVNYVDCLFEHDLLEYISGPPSILLLDELYQLAVLDRVVGLGEVYEQYLFLPNFL